MSIDFDVTDGVARVTLNRPERMNAIDAQAETTLAEIWTAIDRDPGVRCVVLTGTGRAFCAGADMKESGPGGSPTGPAPATMDSAASRLAGDCPCP